MGKIRDLFAPIFIFTLVWWVGGKILLPVVDTFIVSIDDHLKDVIFDVLWLSGLIPALLYLAFPFRRSFNKTIGDRILIATYAVILVVVALMVLFKSGGLEI